MAGLADVFNLALSTLSIAESVDDPNAQNATTASLRRFWPMARDLTLREFPWSCARKVRVLSLASEDPPAGWRYAYNYPSDCLMAIAVMPETGLRTTALWFDSWDRHVNQRPQRYPFDRMLRADGQNQIIVTDLEDAYVLQITRVENPVVYDITLVMAAASQLAQLVGPTLKVKREFVEYAREQFEVWKARAAANDFNESQDDPEPTTPSIAARE
jgi:hypothetical protein